MMVGFAMRQFVNHSSIASELRTKWELTTIADPDPGPVPHESSSFWETGSVSAS